ncbi:MAG: (Fe-S)-binding protein [Desulfobacterales bacterium]|nr:(Fe-S)-binding protein [Desulfobacterales bacterium]
MQKMKQIAEMMKDLETQLDVCTRCGMCQAVCPLFIQTSREADVARGKLALLDGLAREMFSNPKGVNERINRCLLCGSCAAHCPRGVNALEIFIKARSILTEVVGLSTGKKMVLRSMLANPKFFDRMMSMGAKMQGLFSKPANELLGTSCGRIMSPLIADRHILPLAAKPFHKIAPQEPEPDSEGNITVTFFVGCLIDKIFPRIASTAIDIFRHHDIGFYIPDSQGCCGIPALSAGDTATFERLVTYNVEKIMAQSFDYLVTACATCTSTIKKLWPAMSTHMDDELKNNITDIADRTLDISQFLVGKGYITENNITPGKTAQTITYHDPCHLKKSLDVSSEPRTVIKNNAEYRLEEMKDADRCCGLGGSFSIDHYDLSSEIGMKKRKNIISTGCSTVATSCPACMMQLSDMLSKSDDPVVVRHALEIYAEGLFKKTAE